MESEEQMIYDQNVEAAYRFFNEEKYKLAKSVFETALKEKEYHYNDLGLEARIGILRCTIYENKTFESMPGPAKKLLSEAFYFHFKSIIQLYRKFQSLFDPQLTLDKTDHVLQSRIKQQIGELVSQEMPPLIQYYLLTHGLEEIGKPSKN